MIKIKNVFGGVLIFLLVLTMLMFLAYTAPTGNQEDLNLLAEQFNNHLVETSGNDAVISSGNMSVYIDERSNRITITNPTGNVEIFCDKLLVNGKEVEVKE